MSEERGFALEPEAPAPSVQAPRPRGRQKRATRHEEAGAGGVLGALTRGTRSFGNLWVSPRTYYAVGFGLTAMLLWIQFNADFGTAARTTVWELFRTASTWDKVYALAVFLLVSAAGYLLAAVMPAGPTRGLLGIAVGLLAFVTLAPKPEDLLEFMLPVSTAVLVGTLLATRGGLARTRVMIIALALLTSLFFMPVPAQRLAEGGASPTSYGSEAAGLVDVYLNPPADMEDSRWQVFLIKIGSTFSLFIYLVGLLALLGLGGRWSSWAGGLLLSGLVIGWSLVAYFHGSAGDVAHPVWRGLANLGAVWQLWFLPFLLPLAAAVTDLVDHPAAPDERP